MKMHLLALIIFIGSAAQTVQASNWDQTFYEARIKSQRKQILNQRKEASDLLENQEKLYKSQRNKLEKLQNVSQAFEQKPEEYNIYTSTLNRCIENAPKLRKLYFEETCMEQETAAFRPSWYKERKKDNQVLKDTYEADWHKLNNMHKTQNPAWSIAWGKNIIKKIDLGRHGRPDIDITPVERDLKEKIKQKITINERKLQGVHNNLEKLQTDLKRTYWSSLFNGYTTRIYNWYQNQ